jgi:trimeric autotransporter adhesin
MAVFFLPLAVRAQTYYFTGNLPSVPEVSTSPLACDGNSIGAIRYNTATTAFEGCNGVAWADIRNGATAAAAGPSGAVQFNSGGALGGSASLTWDKTNGRLGLNTSVPGELLFVSGGNLAATGTYGSGSAISLSGNQTSMFWNPLKGAFRAGVLDDGDNEWNAGNIGNYSVALGENNEATGDGSVALGQNNSVVGFYSTALGGTNEVSGDGSTAMGDTNEADGYDSTAIGSSVSAQGDNSMALGNAAEVDGQYSMALGLGQPSPSHPFFPVFSPNVTGNSSYGIFMGNQNAVSVDTDNTVAILGGQVVIDPGAPASLTAANTNTNLDVNGNIGAINYCDVNGNNCFTATSIATGAAWNTIANPAGNQALTMAAYTSTWNYGATTGSGIDMFKITDAAANTGTGYLMNITTGATSAASPLHLKANTSGDLVFTSTGRLGMGTTTPGTAIDVNGGMTIEPVTVTLTANNVVLATANRSYFRVTSDNTTATNRIFCFGPGTLGQVLIIEWTSSTNKGEIVKNGNCSGATGAVLASLSYSTWAPHVAETILQLMYNGTHWIQIAGSAPN